MFILCVCYGLFIGVGRSLYCFRHISVVPVFLFTTYVMVSFFQYIIRKIS